MAAALKNSAAKKVVSLLGNKSNTTMIGDAATLKSVNPLGWLNILLTCPIGNI
jgi:hypothetical protein